MREQKDNGATATTLILSMTGIAAMVFGLWLYQWFVILTR